MNPIEVYVLSNERSAKVACNFLDNVAPDRSPVAIDFPFPEYCEKPCIVFDNPNDLIVQLGSRIHETYSIYWDVRHGVSEQVMLFFTADGGMIVGLGGPLISTEQALFLLQKIVEGRFGFVTSGSCPPTSIPEFLSICENSTLENIFYGNFRHTHQ